MTLTEATAALGERSVQMGVDEATERCGIVRRFDGGVDLSGVDLSIAARLEDPENEGLIVQLRAPDGENLVQSDRYFWRAGWVRLDHGPTVVRGEPDLTDVRELRIGMYRGEGSTCRVYVDSVRGLERRERGAVVFTFDDNHASQYEKAFPIFDEYGYPAAAAVIPWKIGESDRLDVDELREMTDAGWEVMSHPQVEATPLPELDRGDARSAIVRSKRWLRDHGFESGAGVIVWPLGKYDERMLEIAREHHEMGFSTATSPVGRITDPMIVPRVNAGEPETAKRMIDMAERFDQVCVLMFHRISPKDRSIHLSESGLRDLLEHVTAADVDVRSVSDIQDALRSG